MIRSHFGLETNPFDDTKLDLLTHQQSIFDTIKVHAQQGGFCLLMGEPGTGKSVIKEAIRTHDPKRMITPTVARTLHTYNNTLQILCDAFAIEAKGRQASLEKLLIQAAWKINHEGKMLLPIIDDAHLLSIDCLRKLRLLFEDFPKNHTLLLVAQPALLGTLRLTVNDDIRSRVTYSAILHRLAPDDLRTFIHARLDRVRLAHNVFDDDALELIIRSSNGFLRAARNLCISTLIETVRARLQHARLEQVNRALMQPHWRKDHDMEPR